MPIKWDHHFYKTVVKLNVEKYSQSDSKCSIILEYFYLRVCNLKYFCLLKKIIVSAEIYRTDVKSHTKKCTRFSTVAQMLSLMHQHFRVMLCRNEL